MKKLHILIVSILVLFLFSLNSLYYDYHIKNETHDEDVTKVVATPIFTKDSGFYDDAFDLELLSEDGADILFTVDGSNPIENGILYIEPIHIYDKSDEKNTISLYHKFCLFSIS